MLSCDWCAGSKTRCAETERACHVEAERVFRRREAQRCVMQRMRRTQGIADPLSSLGNGPPSRFQPPSSAKPQHTNARAHHVTQRALNANVLSALQTFVPLPGEL